MRRQIPTSRGDLGYLEAGREGHPGGTLVLLHAFPLHAGMWEPQLAAPPPAWRVIAPDLPGMGRSDDLVPVTIPAADAPWTPDIDDYAQAVLDLLDAAGARRAVVAGLSMGGYAAFAILRRAADRVAGIVLADTRAQADSEQAAADRQRLIDLALSAGSEAVADQMLPRLLGSTTRATRPDIVDRVRAMAIENSPAGLANALRRLRSRPDSTSLLDSIRCPALVIVGEQDQVTPIEDARAMHRRITGSSLAVIPAAGHLTSVEQPDAFNAALRDFLDATGS